MFHPILPWNILHLIIILLQKLCPIFVKTKIRHILGLNMSQFGMLGGLAILWSNRGQVQCGADDGIHFLNKYNHLDTRLLYCIIHHFMEICFHILLCQCLETDMHKERGILLRSQISAWNIIWSFGIQDKTFNIMNQSHWLLNVYQVE